MKLYRQINRMFSTLLKDKKGDEKYAALQKKITAMTDKLARTLQDLASQQEVSSNLSHELESMRAQMAATQEKLSLISQTLNATRDTNPALAEFEAFIEHEYSDFANSVSIKKEVEAFTKLQSLQRELERLIMLKDIANKSTIAVGGGFSAGKSQFITSFFSDNTIRLPIGVQPVTAIASYIVHGDTHIIKGTSYKSGVVNIPLDTYARLSHDFIQELGFNLKDILPMMAMETHFKDYEHICFVDTPGYNPSGAGAASGDFATATEYLKNSNALIWLIGLDSNGTIPSSDLEFLEQIGLSDKKLYIIANKADLRSPSEIEEILDVFEEILDDYGIEVCGISAYSSTQARELAYRTQDLHSFLHAVDKAIVSKDKLASDLSEVFAIYETELQEEKSKLTKMKSLLNKLRLDILEDGLDMDSSENTESTLSDISDLINPKEIEASLSSLDKLKKLGQERFNALCEEIFGERVEFGSKIRMAFSTDGGGGMKDTTRTTTGLKKRKIKQKKTRKKK